MADLTLGQRIAEERKKLGLSQEALGEKVGVSRQAISKWEADGAVPEIDKLITLGRLFGVSVDWLLGMDPPARQEETVPQIPEEPARTLTLWEKIGTHPAWQNLACLVVALAAVVIAFSFFVRVYRIQNMELDMMLLQSDVTRLEHRIAQLEFLQNTEDRSGTLLALYNFALEPAAEKPETDVTFSATPRNWQEEDQAYLCVSGSIAPIRIPCRWDGDSLSASFTLDFADGYELSFVIEHADGSQQLQLLPCSTLESLKSTYGITTFGSVAEAKYRPSQSLLTLTDMSCSYHRPDLYTDTPVTWQKIYMTLRLDGEEIWRQYDFNADTRSDSTLNSGGGSRGRGTLEIPLPGTELQPGQTLEFRFHAEMSNGVAGEALLGCWTVEETGDLVPDSQN